MTNHTLKSWGLTAIVFAYFAVLESKSALGALAINDGLSGWQHAGLSIVCAILAFAFARIAGNYKSDVRPFVRSAASTARIVSICCIVVPTIYLATSNKHDRVEREWAAYYGTEAYQADVTLVGDMMADAYEREAARERIVKPDTSISIVDVEFMLAAALQVLGVLAAGVPLHRPATEAETKHWQAVYRGRKAAATRKRRKAAKAKKPTLRVVGGKS